MTLRLLDLYCGAGGAAVGYHRAGFDVVGVDIAAQRHYPFAFIQADALEYVEDHGHEFDAIHASPPCQGYSHLRLLPWNVNREYPLLIEDTRDALERAGVPWVIENVMSAPLLSGVTLCGGMFGLRTYRHRRFESSVFIFQPPHPPHRTPTAGMRSYARRRVNKTPKELYAMGWHITVAGDPGSFCGDAMGIDWMTGAELSQAIPPAYTEWVGSRLRQALVRGTGVIGV